MAITSSSEISVVLTDILLKIDRLIEESPHNDSLRAAKKGLLTAENQLRKGKHLSPSELTALNAAADTLRSVVSDDETMANHLYDIQDFLAAEPS